MPTGFWSTFALLYPLYPDETKRQFRSGFKIGFLIVFFLLIAYIIFCVHVSHQEHEKAKAAYAKGIILPYTYSVLTKEELNQSPAISVDKLDRQLETIQRNR